MGFPIHLTQLIEELYQDQQAAVKIEGELSEWFEVQSGVRQGCTLSPYLFNIYSENIMRNVREDPNNTKYHALNIGGFEIPELRYADDTVLLSNDIKGLEQLIKNTKKHSEAQNLYLNVQKTKIMSTDTTTQQPKIIIDNTEIECVDKFQYLGANINGAGNCMAEIRKRLAMASCKITQLKNIWKNNKIETKLLLLRTFIFPVATYGCETWTLNKTATKNINAFEMKCYRKILRISWKEKMKNSAILNILKLEEGWLLNTIGKRKLRLFGHIKRHNCLERQIMEGRAPGKRNRGRPRRRWTDDIRDYMNTTLEKASRIAQDRERFREFIEKTTFWREYVT